MIIQKTQIL